jgi:hypothetical protein
MAKWPLSPNFKYLTEDRYFIIIGTEFNFLQFADY